MWFGKFFLQFGSRAVQYGQINHSNLLTDIVEYLENALTLIKTVLLFKNVSEGNKIGCFLAA